MNERELMRGYRVDPHTLKAHREARHVDRHPFPIVERPLPRKRCPGPNCMTTIAVTVQLCQFCLRSRDANPTAFREAMARRLDLTV